MKSVPKLPRAELVGRGIDVCPVSDRSGAPSIVTASVSAHPERELVEVEVHDALTARRVSRDVDLGAVPEDGRPLAASVALLGEVLVDTPTRPIAADGGGTRSWPCEAQESKEEVEIRVDF